MSKKTGHLRRLRSRLFDRGNTKCPICLADLVDIEVERGRKVTLEHAPPKAMGGQVVCLTCSRCNNAGSILDRAVAQEKKAIDDYASGRGTEIEINLFGARRSGLLRPEEGKPLRFPMPTKVGQLRGKMELRSLPGGSGLDVNKGIGIRIKKPHSDHVNVSLLRSAYLLVFALLGSYGYRYAESEALCKVREQIINPEEKIVDCRIGNYSGLEEDLILISFQFGSKPFFWSVKIGGRGILLPCGGSVRGANPGMKRRDSGFEVRFGQDLRWPAERALDQRSVAGARGRGARGHFRHLGCPGGHRGSSRMRCRGGHRSSCG